MNEMDMILSLLGGISIALIALVLAKFIDPDLELRYPDLCLAIIIAIFSTLSIYVIRRPDWIF